MFEINSMWSYLESKCFSWDQTALCPGKLMMMKKMKLIFNRFFPSIWTTHSHDIISLRSEMKGLLKNSIFTETVHSCSVMCGQETWDLGRRVNKWEIYTNIIRWDRDTHTQTEASFYAEIPVETCGLICHSSTTITTCKHDMSGDNVTISINFILQWIKDNHLQVLPSQPSECTEIPYSVVFFLKI